MLLTRLVRTAVLFLALVATYYFWSAIGFLTGVIRYGGPANQTFSLGMAVVSLVLILNRRRLLHTETKQVKSAG